MSAEEQVEKIRAILAEPWTPEYDAEYVMLRIRLALKLLPDPPSTRGTIEFEGAVIELPDDGDQWGRHDDPEET